MRHAEVQQALRRPGSCILVAGLFIMQNDMVVWMAAGEKEEIMGKGKKD